MLGGDIRSSKASDQSLLVADAHRIALRRHLKALCTITRNQVERVTSLLALAINGLLEVCILY